MMTGKGSSRRPCLVSREAYESAWDAVFAHKRTCGPDCEWWYRTLGTCVGDVSSYGLCDRDAIQVCYEGWPCWYEWLESVEKGKAEQKESES